MSEQMYHNQRSGMQGTLSDFEDMYKEVLVDPEADFVQSDFDEWVSEYLDKVE